MKKKIEEPAPPTTPPKEPTPLQLAIAGAGEEQLLELLAAKGMDSGAALAALGEIQAHLDSTSLRTNRTTEHGRAIARLNMLFLNSLRIQDYKTCLAIQKELNALLGLTGQRPTGARPPLKSARGRVIEADTLATLNQIAGGK